MADFSAPRVAKFIAARSSAARRHAALLPDHQMRPQNYHSSPVPRIGGVALLVAALCTFLWAQTALPGEAAMLWALMGAALPAFVSGVVEDLYKNVSPRMRLLCNAASAGLGIWPQGAVFTRTAIPGIDPMIQWYPAAVALIVSGSVLGCSCGTTLPGWRRRSG